jgi:hypothetical protein
MYFLLLIVLFFYNIKSNESFSQNRGFKLDLKSDLVTRLDELKRDKKINKWNSTLLEAKEVTKEDLFLITRTSWSTQDMLETVLTSANTVYPPSGVKPATVIVTVFSMLSSAILVPQLYLDAQVKNILGIILLLLPFALILLNLVFPGTTLSQGNPDSCKSSLQERICTHEAGHLVLGYLCGVPILQYDVTGEQDAGTAIDLRIDTQEALNEKKGQLLVVAMAGVIAEQIRFGDSKGGAADIPVALEICRLAGIGKDKRQTRGYLRWALIKAITLLRINRDALDKTQELMATGASIEELIQIIEMSVTQ